MTIDRELYREAYETIRQWKLAERAERAYHAGERSPLECWKEYVAWWEFLVSIAPEISETQQAMRLAEWAEYYERMQRFEAWRKEQGKTA
jgi:hypothetical protein